MASETITTSALEIALDRNGAEPWYAALEYEEGTIVVADTLTELVQSLIDDYDPDVTTIRGAYAALDARYDFAVQAAGTRQAMQAFAMNQEGLFDHEAESEEVLTALFSEKDLFVPEIEEWAHQVPLVLIVTDYFPHADRQLPTGNIQWIDPTDELTLLKSLDVLGDFRLHIQSGE